MKVHLLGPIRVVSQQGELVAPISVAQRQLVALLAIHVGEVVPIDTICASLHLTPGAARTTISRLRRLLGPSYIDTERPGYALRADTDVQRFEHLLGLAATAPPIAALDLRSEALELFPWEALPEFADQPWAVGPAIRLNELRAAAVEDRAATLIDLGRNTEAIAELDVHVTTFPYRERPRELMMLALAKEGRQTEALRSFQAYRRRLIDEVGGRPSAHLRAVETAIATERIGPLTTPSRPASSIWLRPRPPPTGFVTFLSTHIDRSAEAWARDPEAMAQAVVRHDSIIDELTTRHAGMRLQQRSDNDRTLTSFADPTQAVLAAIDIQLAFGQDVWRGAARLRIGAALHAGSVQPGNEGEDTEATIGRAGRLLERARGGQVLVSAVVRNIIAESLTPPTLFRLVGRQALEGDADPEPVYRVVHPGLPTEFVDTPRQSRPLQRGGQPLQR